MSTQRSNIVRLRLTDLEKKDWQEAAGGARRLSEWIRAACNAEAERERNPLLVVEATEHLASKLAAGSVIAVPNLKPHVVEDAIARAVAEQDASLSTEEQAHRESRSMPAGGSLRADSSGAEATPERAGAKTPATSGCPREHHHRPGVYCGACKRVIAKR